MKTKHVNRIVAKIVAGLIYRFEDDECEMGNVLHLIPLTDDELDEVSNKLLIMANKLDDKADLPDRRVEWRKVLEESDAK